MKRLSVVIVTYNSENHIYNCIDSVFEYNDIGEDLEVIVVDNCSKNVDKLENTLFQKYGNRVYFLRNKKNGGYGYGNNAGIRVAHSPYIFIINPDVRLIMPLMSNLLKYLDNHKKCAILGIKQEVPDSIGRSFGWSYLSPQWIGYLLYPICRKLDIYLQHYMCIQGACFIVRKKAFQEIGCFDENIFMYGEEDDIHYRFKHNSKYTIKYIPKFRYIHLHKEAKSTSTNIEAEIKLLNNRIYMDKRDGRPSNFAYKYYSRECRVLIFRERLLSFFHMHNKEYLNHLLMWKRYLINHSVL